MESKSKHLARALFTIAWVSIIASILPCTACGRSPLPVLEYPGVAQVDPMCCLDRPVWSPNGDKIVATSQIGGEMIPEARLYILDITTGEVDLLLEAHNAYRSALAWSPDGKRIAFSKGPGSSSKEGIWIMYADGSGVPRFVGEGYLADWSPNGDQLAIAGSFRENVADPWRREIYILDLDDGNKRVVLSRSGDDGFGWQLVWSPDGTRLAFALATTEGQDSTNSRDIFILDIATSQLTQVTQGGDNEWPTWSPDS